MAVLGKRKASDKASEKKISEEEANDIFRRHFEAQFAPIDEPPAKKAATRADDSDDGDEDGAEDFGSDSDEEGGSAEEEWGGLSGDDMGDDDDDLESDEEEAAVEVVDHSSSQPSKTSAMSKRDLKAFMSSKVPDQTSKPKATETTTTNSSSKTLPEDAPSLLKQDLELRRLLSESHLLAPSSLANTSVTSATASNGGTAREPKLFASGRVRQKATDLRAQALGSKTSVFAQDNMPMLVRKGLTASRDRKEAKRRKEARENGIILERPSTVGKKSKQKKRGGLSVDRPGVGRLKGAELRISDRDVKSIEGSRDAFGRKGRGGKRR